MADSHDSTAAAGATESEQPHASQVESRVIFEQAMGQASLPVKHEKTSVLLLGWNPDNDDTGVAGEVS